MTQGVKDYKSGEFAFEKGTYSYELPVDDSLIIAFDELFNIEDLQKLQDQFADAFSVASIITHPDGKPITRPSNFSRLCEHVIRCTEKGRLNCMHSDAVLGRHHPDGPVVQPCLSGGLWDAGASITVGGKHVASWLIGQVRNQVQEESGMLEYAREIGANEEDFIKAFREIPVMSLDQFQKAAKMLFTMAGQLSDKAYQNVQQARFINERIKAQAALIESEERYRTTLYSIGDGVITTDTEGRVKIMNPVAEALTEWSQEEASGRKLEEVFPIINEETREQVEIPVRRVLREGSIVGLANHTLLISRNGIERPIADSGSPIRNEKGEIVGVILVFRDQTEERKAERDLRESEEKFRSIVESSPIGKYQYYLNENEQLIFMGANPAADRIIGINHETLTGKTLQEAFPNLATTDVPEKYKMVAKGEIGPQQFEIDYSDSQVVGCYEVTVYRIGENWISVDFLDVSERKNAEIALRESEEKFRTIVESSPNGMHLYKLNEEGELIFLQGNKSADRMLGLDHQKIEGLKIEQAFSKLTETSIPDLYKSIARGETGLTSFEVPYNEGSIHGIYDVTVFKSGENAVTVNFVDNTEQKLAEKAIRESEERFKNLFENAAVGISMTQMDGTMRINHRLHEMLGYTESEFRNKKWQEITHPDDIQLSSDVVTNLLEGKEKQIRFQKRYLHKDGSIVWTDVSTTLHYDVNDQPEFFITSISDITERKQFELKLQRSEQELKRAQQITHIGSWYLNLADNEVIWSEELYRMYGFDPNLPVPPYTEHMKLFTPESWELLSASLTNTAETGIPYELELKTVRDDGSNGWMWVRGETVKDTSGKIVALWGAAQDISERKQAEQALFDSEEMMRNSQAVAHICSYSTNLNENEIGKSVWKCSPEFYNIFGIDKTYPHTIEGWAGFIHPDFREEIVAYHERVIKERIPFEHEYKIIRINDGAERWVYGTGQLEFDEKGNPIRMHGAIQDITERKMNLEAIQNERTLLRTLIDNLPVSIYVKDAQCRKVVANLTDVENMGYASEKDVLGKTDLELFDKEDGERGYRDDLAVIQTGEPVINRERSFSDPKGNIRWSLTSKLPLFDHKGKVSGLVGISRDITEQKRANETIQKLSKSIEQSPSIVMITDIKGNIEYVNPKFTEITGYSLDEILGRNPRFLKSGEMTAALYEELWRNISSGGVWRGEFHNRKKNGDLYWEWATITSIKNENGEINNYIAIKEDISLRKQMEAELIIAKEKAEESDRLKSAFLANMSHEIRTPLNSIIGFSELLTDSAFQDDQKTQFIETIITNGNNLLNIISDIVDISKIESGEITIRNSVIPVQALLDSIKSNHLLKVEEKKLQLKCIYPTSESGSELSVFADRERLYQIFNNLISNALKFTSEGYIEIGCRLVHDRIEFHVTDTGIGIPPDYHAKIFDRFRQVEASYTRKFGGNGLGLAISKNLIELMGGRIWVESELGKGATFYFTLPKS